MRRFETGVALRWLESLWQDLRLSARSLLRSPGTTVAATQVDPMAALREE